MRHHLTTVPLTRAGRRVVSGLAVSRSVINRRLYDYLHNPLTTIQPVPKKQRILCGTMAQTTVERVIPSLASPPLVPPAHPSCCPRATVYFENSRCFVVVVAPCYSFSLARCWFPSWDSIPVVAPPRLPPVVSNVHGLISIPCDAAFACHLPALSLFLVRTL